MTADQAEPIPAEVERVGRRVIGASITVHRTLGPGYKESIYVEALCLELDSRGFKFEREKPITTSTVRVTSTTHVASWCSS